MQEVKQKTSHSLDIKSEKTSDIPLSLSLSPIGHLSLYSDPENTETLPKSIAEKIHSFFSVSESVGLLRLGLSNFGTSLPASFTFWQQFSKLFITEICKAADLTEQSAIPDIAFPADEINELIAASAFYTRH